MVNARRVAQPAAEAVAVAIIRGAGPGATQAADAATPHPRLTLRESHLDADAFQTLLSTASLLITHAGHSTVCQALLADTHMLLLPLSQETLLTATAAKRAAPSRVHVIRSPFNAGAAGSVADLAVAMNELLARDGAAQTDEIDSKEFNEYADKLA